MTHLARSHAAPLGAVAGRRQARRLFGAMGALLRQSSRTLPDCRAVRVRGRPVRDALLAQPLLQASVTRVTDRLDPRQ